MGVMTNDPKAMKQHLVDLLNDKDMAKEVGDNARNTIVKKYSAQQFVDNWNETLTQASNIVFRG